MKLLIILLCVTFVLGNFTLTITKNKIIKTYKFNGLLWVSLDRYSIWKYSSTDIPKKLFEFTQTKA